jgi:hypothetical protein
MRLRRGWCPMGQGQGLALACKAMIERSAEYYFGED